MPQSVGKSIWTQFLRAHISFLHRWEKNMPLTVSIPSSPHQPLPEGKAGDTRLVPDPTVFVTSLRTAISPSNQKKKNDRITTRVQQGTPIRTALPSGSKLCPEGRLPSASWNTSVYRTGIIRAGDTQSVPHPYYLRWIAFRARWLLPDPLFLPFFPLLELLTNMVSPQWHNTLCKIWLKS